MGSYYGYPLPLCSLHCEGLKNWPLLPGSMWLSFYDRNMSTRDKCYICAAMSLPPSWQLPPRLCKKGQYLRTVHQVLILKAFVTHPQDKEFIPECKSLSTLFSSADIFFVHSKVSR